MTSISRRHFILSASVLLATAPALAKFKLSTATELYINTDVDGLLSLDVRWDNDDGPRDWTRKEIYLHDYAVDLTDIDKPLEGDVLDHALSEFGGEDPEDEEFLAYLEEPDPSNDKEDDSRPQLQEYIYETSATAQASQFLEDIRSSLPKGQQDEFDEFIGFYNSHPMDMHIAGGKLSYMDPDNGQALQVLLEKAGLNIEVIVT
jgi:hypothetical protein